MRNNQTKSHEEDNSKDETMYDEEQPNEYTPDIGTLSTEEVDKECGTGEPIQAKGKPRRIYIKGKKV